MAHGEEEERHQTETQKVVWEMGAEACVSVLYVLSLTFLCPLHIHLSVRLSFLYIPRLSVVPVDMGLASLM